MSGYNLPDNVRVNDPYAPWNQTGEYEVVNPRQVGICLEKARELMHDLRVLRRSEDASLFNPGWELESVIPAVAGVIEDLESLI